MNSRPAGTEHLDRKQNGGQLTQGTILSIDDEVAVTHALRRLLGGRYDMTVVDDARLGYDLLLAGARFDVILCDVLMPLLNGMRFYEKVYALDPAQATRIVFLTGAAVQGNVRAFLDGLPNRRLEKPFSLQAIEAVIGELALLRH